MKLTKQHIDTIYCDVTGYTHPSMPGVIIHYLAPLRPALCRHSRRRQRRGGWMLTHTASGMNFHMSTLSDKQEALCFFEYLRATDIDWTLTQLQLHHLYPNLAATILDAFNRAIGGRPRQKVLFEA